MMLKLVEVAGKDVLVSGGVGSIWNPQAKLLDLMLRPGTNMFPSANLYRGASSDRRQHSQEPLAVR